MKAEAIKGFSFWRYELLDIKLLPFMTVKEFKEAIATSKNKEWYQNYELTINYPHIHYNRILKGVINIYEFVVEQSDNYSQLSNLPDELDKIRVRFIAAKGNILQLFSQGNTNKNNWDDNLRAISGYYAHQPIFLYGFVETDFLLKTYKERPDFFIGAFDFLKGDTSKVTQKQYLQGYILAYEFSSKEFSEIAERKDVERRSMSKISTDFSDKLGEAQRETIEVISKTRQKFEEYVKAMDALKDEKNSAFNEWFGITKRDFLNFNNASNRQVKELENLYIEKLKLEAPAQYWNKRAIRLRGEGKRWLIGMIICLSISAGILVCILSMIADGTLQKIFSETSAAIKWSVAFITLISFLAYGIRTFAKLTFSSYHLVRDAEEREQLTYVYLALKKEKDIDQTERHLIMQSLFSRADSGLLKDDSGPTMPGQIIDQVPKR